MVGLRGHEVGETGREGRGEIERREWRGDREKRGLGGGGGKAIIVYWINTHTHVFIHNEYLINMYLHTRAYLNLCLLTWEFPTLRVWNH
jgi:hypothetical protein